MTTVGRVLGPAILAVAAACGGAEWREADARLNASAQGARALGYAPLSGPHNDFGVFTAAGEARASVPLRAGADYFIAAACTTGCDSLDFDVLGPDGAAVASDTGAGATPRLVLRPAADGAHTLLVRHGACRRERCRWVAQVYLRRE